MSLGGGPAEGQPRPSAEGTRADRSWWRRPASTRSFLIVMSVGAAASVVVLVGSVRPLFEAARIRAARSPGVVARGPGQEPAGAELTVRVAPPENGHQRIVAPEAAEPLATGERILLGVRAGSRRFIVAVCLDDRGNLTPLYPEDGIGLELPPSLGLHNLPDGIELTGHGFERLIVLLTDQPIEPDIVRAAAASAFTRADRNLLRLPRLDLPGDQFQRTFLRL